MEKFHSIVDKLSALLDTIGGLVMAAIMILITSNVILRLFGLPIKGTAEWIQFLMAVVVGLTISYCAAQGGHISVTLLVDKMPKKIQTVVEIIVGILVITFVSLAARVLVDYGISLRTTGQVGMVTFLPYYPFVFIIALGFVVYALVTLSGIIKTIQRGADR